MNNESIRYIPKFKIILSGIILLFTFTVPGQQTKSNPYGLEIIKGIEEYDSLIKGDSLKRLVDLTKYIPGIRLDIRYATRNNFTHEVIYTESRAYVRLPVAKALRAIQKALRSKGLGLKVFDAYRPYSATLQFYQIMKDTVFVAAPWKGSRHNRGCAVDASLIDLTTGKELNMPTPFDDFTKKAGSTYPDLPKKVLKNRSMLINEMNAGGFTVYPDEWWHFDYKGWEKYELMDLSFEELDEVR